MLLLSLPTADLLAVPPWSEWDSVSARLTRRSTGGGWVNFAGIDGCYYQVQRYLQLCFGRTIARVRTFRAPAHLR